MSPQAADFTDEQTGVQEREKYTCMRLKQKRMA